MFQALDFKYDEDDKHYEIKYLYQAKKQLLIPVKAIISGKVSLFFATWLIKSTANYSHFISK